MLLALMLAMVSFEVLELPSKSGDLDWAPAQSLPRIVDKLYQ